jgi:internalin A
LDDFDIALQRIAEEAERKTGVLDLGNLDLAELPQDLARLTHLRRLNLGLGRLDDNGELQIGPDDRWLDVKALSDLTLLQNFLALQSLACVSTKVSDLTPLRKLGALQSLDCSGTEVGDLTPLQNLSTLQSLACWGSKVSDLTPLQNLTGLQSLDCTDTKVSDLTPLRNLIALQALSVASTKISDLTPLQNLRALRSLHCGNTKVSDLAPLRNLTALQSLTCAGTEVSDLAPLWNLTALQSLYCSRTKISDLAPLQNLVGLQSFYCSTTKISDLTPLHNLTGLQSLTCRDTEVSDLTPLQNLTGLRSLDCGYIRISDLSPLRNLAALQSLSCWGTGVSDLTPLQNLAALQWLDCSRTKVGDLMALSGLPDLQHLDCSRCRLTEVEEAFWFKPSLTELFLYDSQLPGVPSEVLSRDRGENCLDSLRAHLRDLDAGLEPVADVKLMVLGNGRIGKTQICRRLRGEAYDAGVASTHGITVTSAPLPGAADGEGRLQIWDFGGQDIYHGTHALFLRSRAIFLLVWIPQAENADEVDAAGNTVRNQPLAYWLDYVRQFGGASSPVLVLQTRCDRPEDETVRPPLDDAALAGFPFRKLLHYSALKNSGRGALDEAVAGAAAWLRDHQGTAEIGAGRMRVKRRLEQIRDDDTARPNAERRHRTLSHEEFVALCNENNDVSDPAQLLAYLHHAGIVFHRDGLFHDRIILDQSWALEAIYAVFHRDRCVKLRRQKGRFTRSDLAEWLWAAAGHSVADQELLLSMMQSCGICFIHRQALPDKDIEAEYIAPDLLPEKAEIESELVQKWDPALHGAQAEFGYALLPQRLIGALISRVGAEAGLNADYWRGGFYVYEATTGSRAMIEQRLTKGSEGRIGIVAQRGQAAVLVERLSALLREQERRIGIESTVLSLTPSARSDGENSVFNRARRDTSAPTPAETPPLVFTQEPARAAEWCVSYAWGDDSKEGREREAVVDQLCAEALARGTVIIRDKTTLGLGDRISKFMRRLGRADRLFVILSDKYLKSPFCMTELCELWLRCSEDETELLRRVRVYTLPDAKIFSPYDRAQYAVHWKQQYERLADLVAAHGDEILGEKDAHRYRLMKKFSRQVGDVLATVADILQPSNFEQLKTYGFDGGPP